jgi:hypothetical protein
MGLQEAALLQQSGALILRHSRSVFQTSVEQQGASNIYIIQQIHTLCDSIVDGHGRCEPFTAFRPPQWHF